MRIQIGFSPCPNDTFIFDALVNRKIDTGPYEFEPFLEDVETLNQWAAYGKLDVTKLSFHQYLRVVDQYALLHSGAALGRGVGPLLVATPESAAKWQQPGWLEQAKIAIPGINTTANLLLSLALPEITDKTEVLFSDIEKGVKEGSFDAGLIIHESRFTYRQKGLVRLLDLGEWWEQQEQALIPLGGIAIKRGISRKIASEIDALIRESLAFSWNRYPELSNYVTDHAQEMEGSVMRQHIELYVNEFTTELGESGTAAVSQLFRKAVETGMIRKLPSSIFY